MRCWFRIISNGLARPILSIGCVAIGVSMLTTSVGGTTGDGTMQGTSLQSRTSINEIPRVDGSLVLPAPFFDVPPAPGLSNAPRDWSLVIARRGGISGNHPPDIVMTSEGTAWCGPNICSGSVQPSDVALIVELMNEPWQSFDAALRVYCLDCTQTIVLTKWRDDSSVEHRRMAFWDETTVIRVPPNVTRLFGLVSSRLWTTDPK